MRIGLLGGSFDPVHIAHIALACKALSELSLDQVQLIPAGQPWQKAALGAQPEHRLAMLKLAVGSTEKIVINPVEINRGGPTYTIDTVMGLPGGNDYFWILGADQLQNFCSWLQWSDIAQRVQLVVAERPGSHSVAPAELTAWMQHHRKPLIHLPFEPLNVSANEIRRRIGNNETISELIPEPVENYISAHGLYRRHQSDRT